MFSFFILKLTNMSHLPLTKGQVTLSAMVALVMLQTACSTTTISPNTINSAINPAINPNAINSSMSETNTTHTPAVLGMPNIHQNTNFNVNSKQSATTQLVMPQPPSDDYAPNRRNGNITNHHSQGSNAIEETVPTVSGIEHYQAAKRAANNGDQNSLYRYEQMMAGSLFAMYPTYWRLNNELSSLSPNSVIAFVKQYPNTALSEKLVADYAEAQATQGNYQAVKQVSPHIKNADTSERCAMALGELYGGGQTQVMIEKQKVWLNTKKQPALCAQLATELNAYQGISQDERQQRLYRMLRMGNNGDIIALSRLLGMPISHEELTRINQNPNAFFTQMAAQPPSSKNRHLYLYAIGRLTAKSYREAHTQLAYDVRQDANRRNKLLDDATRQMAYRTIAVKRMNMNTDDGFSHEAVDWFRQSMGQPFNFEEAEDYAQASIRYSEWQDVINAISHMDKSIQGDDIWQYWLARAYEHGNHQQQGIARQIYERLANHTDYYGLLAKDKLGRRLNINQMGGGRLPQVSHQDRMRVKQNANFARAFALYHHNGDPSDTKREWNWAVKQARDRRDDGLLMAAALQAHELGWHDRAIYALDSSETVSNLAITHPTPYRNSVLRHSRHVGIDPAWSYGIMRQESRFNESARSHVGAGGLMQIMPNTAKHIAHKLGEPPQNTANPNTNIRYGTWYLSNNLQKVGHQPAVATAGYNAGSSKAIRWLPNHGNLSADQYIETIPYYETKDYVKKVMENATFYGYLLGQPKPISERMGVVRPK